MLHYGIIDSGSNIELVWARISANLGEISYYGYWVCDVVGETNEFWSEIPRFLREFRSKLPQNPFIGDQG
jgi:hypothetical protein